MDPYSPGAANWRRGPLEETQNWEVGGEGSERPRTGHHSQEKEGLHLRAQAETRKWEERGGAWWCVTRVMKKSLLSLIEQALFMISKAEELKCLSSTLFFLGLKI